MYVAILAQAWFAMVAAQPVHNPCRNGDEDRVMMIGVLQSRSSLEHTISFLLGLCILTARLAVHLAIALFTNRQVAFTSEAIYHVKSRLSVP